MNISRRTGFFATLSLIVTTMVLATSAMALVFLAPVVAYKYMKKDAGYTATAAMPAAPAKVYSTAVGLAEEKTNIKIVKKEDENMFIEVTDGLQTASVQVMKTDDSGKSEIAVNASLPKEEGQEKKEKTQKEKELALRIVERLCAKLEVECTVAKE